MDPFATTPLGRTSMTVTRMGLGTAPLGGEFGAVDDATARAVVDRSWERGIRWFDTAPFYGIGLSERRLGQALAERDRSEYILSTKVGRLLRPVPDADSGVAGMAPVFDFSGHGVRRSLEESLERLGMERVDIVHVHDPDDHQEEALDAAFPTLLALRDEGIVKAVSAGMNQAPALARFVRESDLDCVLLAGRYTLLDQVALDDLLPLCAQRGVAVIAAGVFNSGILADPSEGATYNYKPAHRSLIARARAINGICERHGVPLQAAAMQFPLAHPAVTTVLVGMMSPAEVDHNATAFTVNIPAALWEELRAEGFIRDDAPVPQ